MKKSFIVISLLLSAFCFKASALTLTLGTWQSTQLTGEPYELFVNLRNDSASPVYLADAFFSWQTTLVTDGETRECSHLYFGFSKPADVRWKEMGSGDSMKTTVPNDLACLCRKSEEERVGCKEWWQRPGKYTFTLHLQHSPRKGDYPRPKGTVFSGEIQSNSVEIEVKEPTGVDAQVLKWANDHQTIPTNPFVLHRFPTSTYAAWVVVQKFQGFSGSDFGMVMNSIESGDYLNRELWVPEENASGQKPIHGIEALNWKRQYFGIILQNHPDFPFADQLKLMLALDELALKQYEFAARDLRQVASESKSDMKDKADLCLQLAQQKGWIK